VIVVEQSLLFLAQQIMRYVRTGSDPELPMLATIYKNSIVCRHHEVLLVQAYQTNFSCLV
jgi:hypothetical protein